MPRIVSNCFSDRSNFNSLPSPQPRSTTRFAPVSRMTDSTVCKRWSMQRRCPFHRSRTAPTDRPHQLVHDRARVLQDRSRPVKPPCRGQQKRRDKTRRPSQTKVLPSGDVQGSCAADSRDLLPAGEWWRLLRASLSILEAIGPSGLRLKEDPRSLPLNVSAWLPNSVCCRWHRY
jgi:hypothetical protein